MKNLLLIALLAGCSQQNSAVKSLDGELIDLKPVVITFEKELYKPENFHLVSHNLMSSLYNMIARNLDIVSDSNDIIFLQGGGCMLFSAEGEFELTFKIVDGVREPKPVSSQLISHTIDRSKVYYYSDCNNIFEDDGTTLSYYKKLKKDAAPTREFDVVNVAADAGNSDDIQYFKILKDQIELGQFKNDVYDSFEYFCGLVANEKDSVMVAAAVETDPNCNIVTSQKPGFYTKDLKILDIIVNTNRD